MRKLHILLILALSAEISLAQVNHPKEKQEILAVCVKFMDAFKSERFVDAFGIIKPYSGVESSTLDTMASNVKKQWATVKGRYGKMLSYELVSEKDVKNSLIRVVYLLKLEKFFLKLVFTLYNNGDGWAVTGFDYTEKTDDLF
jgi:hypothetical protein